MAAVAAALPAWETARKMRSFQQFIEAKCIQKGHENVNIEAADFDVTLLDERKMKSHILDCIVALGIVQQELISQKQPSILREDEQPLTTKTQAALSNKVFKTAISMAATEFIRDGTEVPTRNESVDKILRAFPDESKLTDGRNWLPLHWVVANENFSEVDVKMMYISDPTALQQCHLEGTDKDNLGFTCAHLLCTQEMTQRNMSLIQHFSICYQQAFTMSASYPNRGDPLIFGFSALHAACCYGQPTEGLLKHLLQLDRSQTKKILTSILSGSEDGLTPLGYLCKNSNCNDRLISCLLDVDSSTEVVGRGIAGCITSTDYPHMLERVEMLLKANPDTVNYRNSYGLNLLHLAARYETMPFQLCIDVMQRILAIRKDAVREVSYQGDLPVHIASYCSTVEVVEFLLGLYPESASVVSSLTRNLLHMAVGERFNNSTSVMEAKVRFLCSRYPAMMLERSGDGHISLNCAIKRRNILAMQILCQAEGQAQEQVRLPTAHATDAIITYPLNGWLSLHFLINYQADLLRDSLLTKEADCFRMFLRWYPEAAGIEGVDHRLTPYQLAVDGNLPPYYLRLLLRAAPDLNPAELHRLNYEERRMAMFLAFKAQTKNIEPLLLARLRFAKKDLVEHVMSFL